MPEVAQPDIREVFEGPYRVIYRLRPDDVQVLAVVHARRAGPGALAS